MGSSDYAAISKYSIFEGLISRGRCRNTSKPYVPKSKAPVIEMTFSPPVSQEEAIRKFNRKLRRAKRAQG